MTQFGSMHASEGKGDNGTMQEGFDNDFIKYQNIFIPCICTFFHRLRGFPSCCPSMEHLKEEEAEQGFAVRLTSSLGSVSNGWYLKEKRRG